jgi:hypothetical protein
LHVQKTTKFILKTYVVLPVVCLHLVVPEWIAHTHNAHSKLEDRILFPNSETGNCRTTQYPFYYLGTWTETPSAYRWHLKVRNGSICTRIICNLITITERLIIRNSLFLIDFKWGVFGPLILITIANW